MRVPCMGKIDSQLGRSLEHKFQLHSARDYMDGIIRSALGAANCRAREARDCCVGTLILLAAARGGGPYDVPQLTEPCNPLKAQSKLNLDLSATCTTYSAEYCPQLPVEASRLAENFRKPVSLTHCNYSNYMHNALRAGGNVKHQQYSKPNVTNPPISGNFVSDFEISITLAVLFFHKPSQPSFPSSFQGMENRVASAKHVLH